MNIDILLQSSLAIQLHVVAALAAFFVGAAVLWRRKGNTAHKRWGKIWVVLMVATALTSLFIHEIRLVGPFSPIHLISVGTLFSLYIGVRQARQGQITRHKNSMKSTFLGGMVIAGGLAFMPGRRMYEVTIAPIVEFFTSSEVSGVGFMAGNWMLPLGVATGSLLLAFIGNWYAQRKQKI